MSAYVVKLFVSYYNDCFVFPACQDLLLRNYHVVTINHIVVVSPSTEEVVRVSFKAEKHQIIFCNILRTTSADQNYKANSFSIYSETAAAAVVKVNLWFIEFFCSPSVLFLYK